MWNTNPKLLLLLLISISLIACMFFFNRSSINNNFHGYLRDSNKSVYGEILPFFCLTHKEISKNSWQTRECPQSGIVTVAQGGRLGNHMWQYASAWGVARRVGLQAYVPACIKNRLSEVFENLSLPTLEEIWDCPVNENNVSSITEWKDPSQSIVIPKFAFQDFVVTWKTDLIQEFQFRQELRKESQEILHLAAKSSNQRNVVFISVHVRRTDYLVYVKNKYGQKSAGRRFYLNAMDIFKKEYPNVLFVIISDDVKWCVDNINVRSNVYIVNQYHKNSPGLDLAILASCNHSIYDYGTFGQWGAILSGGSTIFYNISEQLTSRNLAYLKNWRALS